MTEATASVVAPGLPAGVKVVETGVNDGAAKAPAPGPAFVSDTAGMSDSQAAAIRWVDANRAALAANTSNLLLQRQNKAALAHVFHGGPVPDFLPKSTEQQAQDAERNAREADSDRDAMEAAAAPMQAEEREHVATHGRIAGLPAEIAGEVADFAAKAELPVSLAKQVTERVAQHERGGWGLAAALSAEDHAELRAECSRRFGGEEKMLTEAGLAHAYLKHIGLAHWADRRAGSLQYDPPTILALAFKARQLGLRAG